MLIVKVKEGEKIDKALKRYKNKYRKTKVSQELRKRKHFRKKSEKRREEVKKVIYAQNLKDEDRD